MIADLADLLVAALNAGTFSESFTAARRPIPLFNLEELKDLTVTVVPRTLETTMLTRRHDMHEIAIDIAIQKRVESEDNDELDPLLNLVQEINDAVNRTDLGGAKWLKTENDPIYAPDHLHEKRVFTSVLTVTYSLTRDAGTLAATGTGT